MSKNGLYAVHRVRLLRDWLRYAASHAVNALPAQEADVYRYLCEHVATDSRTRLENRLAVIVTIHRRYGFTTAADYNTLREAIGEERRPRPSVTR